MLDSRYGDAGEDLEESRGSNRVVVLKRMITSSDRIFLSNNIQLKSLR